MNQCGWYRRTSPARCTVNNQDMSPKAVGPNGVHSMEILFRMTQAMSVFVVVAYICCKSPLLRSLTTDAVRTADRVYLYLVFSALSILGTYLGVPVHDAIANTRAIGPVLAGIIGGPVLG